MREENIMAGLIKELVEMYGVDWDDDKDYLVSVDVWHLGHRQNEILQVDSNGYMYVYHDAVRGYELVTSISRSDRLRVHNIALDYYAGIHTQKIADLPIS